MVLIDGIEYNVGISSLVRISEFLDASASRSLSGTLKRKLIGVFCNYEVKFVMGVGVDYNALYEKLTEPVEFHTIVMPYNNETLEFEAYITGAQDQLVRSKGNVNYWGDLTVRFIAKDPYKRV